MTSGRRAFLRTLAASAALPACAAVLRAAQRSTERAPGAASRRVVKPPRLRPGDVVGLVDPASITWEPVEIEIVEESLAALGLKTQRGANVLNRRGYLAGSDQERAA